MNKLSFLLIIYSILNLIFHIHCSKLSIQVQGGSQASSQEFPFLVSIQYQDSSSSTPQHICGGSIIASKYILTAAHCNFEDSGAVTSPSKLTIVYGTNILTACPSKVGTYSACQRVQVKSISVHEKYDGNSVVNDVAIYELATDISLPTSNIAMIPMANAAVGTPHYIIGWGLTNDNVGTASNYLMKGLAPIVDDKYCNSLGLDMSQSKGQLCAGSGNGIDACSGDSGGGLAMQVQISNSNSTTSSNSTGAKLWVVSGLVSYGPEGCGISSSYSNRGVYTSVAYFKTWIASKVSSNLIYYSGNGIVIDQGTGATNASTSTKHITGLSNLASQLTFHFLLITLLFLFAL